MPTQPLVAPDSIVPTDSGFVAVSPEQFHARRITWEAIVREGCHLFWHPQIVDYALERVASASSVEEIVASELFRADCERFATDDASSLGPSDLSAEKLLQARDDPRQGLLNAFISRQTARAIKALSINNTSPSAVEELADALRYQYVLNAAKYRPGIELPDGTFRTFGYAAFHVNFIREAWNLIKTGFRSTTSIQTNPAFDAECDSANVGEAQSIAPGWHPTFKITLIETLRHALSEPMAWDVFNGLMFDDLTLEEIAAHVGISAAYISMTVTPGIVSSFQAAFDLPTAVNRNNDRVKITDMREPLCRLLSKEEFVRLIPRPPLPMPRMTSGRHRRRYRS